MAYIIKGFNPHTFIDWAGKLASVVYLPGCNFRCPFCHSKALVQEIDTLSDISFDYIEKFLKEKSGWLDSVVIGGGEPTLHADLPELLKKIKKINYLVKLDTNGTNPLMLSGLISEGLVDYVAMDIKAPLDKEKYSCLAGAEVNLAAIKNSIEIIMKSVIDYEFRTTVVPGLLEIDDILRIAKDVYGAKRYVLQQFDPKEALDCSLHAVKPYDTQILIQAALSAKEFVRDCFVRGI